MVFMVKILQNGITEVDYTYEDIRVTGVLGNVSVARSNRNGQIFFVNQRYVKDKTLTSGVDQAYKDLLPMGKYGFAILNLEMDPSQVDCNVHPAKLEVRFADEQKVFKAIYHAIQSKNEELRNKTIVAPEIANQEQLDKMEEKTEETVSTKREEFKPREGTFSGFFKMFKPREEEENTIIKDIYEARKNAETNENSKEEPSEETEKTTTKLEESIEKTDLAIEKELENLRKKADEILNRAKNDVVPQEEEKQPEDVKLQDDAKPQEVKLGNTIISSDTRESAYDVKDLMEAAKQETVRLDTTKLLSVDDSKTEIMDSIKKIEEDNKRETVEIDTEKVRNEETVIEENEEQPISENVENEENNTVTERLLEQKVKSDMEDTQFVDTERVRDEIRASKEDDIPVTKDFANMYKKVFGMEVSTVRKTREEENAKLDISNNIQMAEDIENETVFEKTEEGEEVPSISYKYIGTIFDSYAIIEIKDEMYMIEKNAAEERLMYEVVKEDYYNEETDNSVSLLLADIVTLTPKEMSIARDLEPMFRKSGFEYDEFGECTLKLIKVPNWAENLNTKKLFMEILKEMDTVAVTATQEKEEKFIATVSNKFVALSDTFLTDSELRELISRLLKLPNPFMYPNGRLTAVKISKANMEKKFSRR